MGAVAPWGGGRTLGAEGQGAAPKDEGSMQSFNGDERFREFRLAQGDRQVPPWMPAQHFCVWGHMTFDAMARQGIGDAGAQDASSCFLMASAKEPERTLARWAPDRVSFYRRRGKRALDMVLVLAFAPVWVPLVLLLSLVARLDGGPAFFGHERVGRGEKTFRCWKLRTMVPDAQHRLVHYLAENPSAAVEWAQSQKLSQDPRVTVIGRVFRKSSLDELPQLFNVLLGHMSLVGPRPVTEVELNRYGPEKPAYISVRPGVTGLWQVRGRNEKISYAERVELDAEYAGGCSAALDISVLLKTIPAVLKMSGQ